MIVPPLLAPEPYTIFVDESGDHSLAKIQPSYPLFGLAGILMETSAHAPFATALSAWKQQFFGADVCLHMQEITRNKGPFGGMSDAAYRAKFFTELQLEIDKVDFMVICSVILKDKLIQEYGAIAHNPYYLTLAFLVERFALEMNDRDSRAGFVAESRGNYLDTALQAQYAALLANGTPYVAGKLLRKRLSPTILFQGKHPGSMGLQLADLAVGPICRHVANMKRQEAIRVGHRMRKSPSGKLEGWGLKIFP